MTCRHWKKEQGNAVTFIVLFVQLTIRTISQMTFLYDRSSLLFFITCMLIVCHNEFLFQSMISSHLGLDVDDDSFLMSLCSLTNS
jgi:hypothetical protein